MKTLIVTLRKPDVRLLELLTKSHLLDSRVIWTEGADNVKLYITNPTEKDKEISIRLGYEYKEII